MGTDGSNCPCPAEQVLVSIALNTQSDEPCSMNPVGTNSSWEVALAVLVLNLPFGFWRAGVETWTRPWFLAVHLPVPIVVALRIVSHLGWHFTTFPLLVGSFFLGQFLGGKLRQAWKWSTTTGDP